MLHGILLMAPLLMVAAALKVDHVTVAGRSLTEMQKMLEDAGIPTEFGGKHSNGMTEMALASFEDASYLELIAPQTGADVRSHYWGKDMMEQSGPAAWAIATKDLPGDVKRLESAGISVQTQSSGRKRPDGVELKWETATVGPGPQGSFFPFLIHDETPRERRAFPHGRPSLPGISGVLFVVVAVRDLPQAIEKYRAAFGLGEPQSGSDKSLGARLAWFKGTPVVLAGPASANSWLAARLKQFGETPCAFVLGAKSFDGFATTASEAWFSHTLAWLDPAKLGGMRIAISKP